MVVGTVFLSFLPSFLLSFFPSFFLSFFPSSSFPEENAIFGISTENPPQSALHPSYVGNSMLCVTLDGLVTGQIVGDIVRGKRDAK